MRKIVLNSELVLKNIEHCLQQQAAGGQKERQPKVIDNSDGSFIDSDTRDVQCNFTEL